VVATCKGVIKLIKIDPEAVDPEDVESLEDMVLLAVNNAVEEGQKIQAEEMGKVTSGFGLPGMG
jgi:DNA-binding protein YbaB